MMLTRKYLLVIFISLVMVGCAQQITLMNQFDEASALKALQAGKNTIKGSALIKQNNGGSVTCAGTSVRLIPVNAYSIERFQYIYNNTDRGFTRQMFANQASPFANDNPAYRQAVKETVCDAQGFFKFENIADGEFFVLSAIQWNPTGGIVLQGGSLFRKVAVKGGETKEVVLAP
jgi:hypothetical protein